MKLEAEYCKKHHADKVASTIEYADMFTNHVFLFNTENDLEQLDDAITYGEKIDWTYMPGDDKEYLWQFNRTRWWIVMGQAYQLTGDEKYAKEYAAQLVDWVKSNPLTPEVEWTTWRILEAGFRGEYWTKAYELFKDSQYVTEEVTNTLFDCLRVHGRYLTEKFMTTHLLSNWGVIQSHGLFMIAVCLPQDEEAIAFRNTALDRLGKICRMGVMPDGVQWEQSPMYHNEVLKDLLDVVIIAKRHGIQLPDGMEEIVHRMSMADLAWRKPNGHQIMNGDTDDFDLSQYLCKAAICYQDPVLKYGAKPHPDFEMVWEVGMDAVKAYEDMEAKAPEFTSIGLMESGNFYLREDWSKDSNLLHFHCGTLGAGHDHANKLHIDLIAKGEDVLMDGGRFTYVNCDKRREYKAASMHNTIRVDGQEYYTYKDSWENTTLSQPINQKYVSKEAYEFVQGGHLGYIDKGVLLNRKIVHIKPDIYIIADECYGSGSHEYESYWHFNENGKVELVDNNHTIYRGSKADTHFYFISEGIKTEKIATHISRSYNHESDNETVKMSWQGGGFASCITVVKVVEHGSEETFAVEKMAVNSVFKSITHPSSWAEAVKTTVAGKEYVTIICHQEVNTPTDMVEADGCMGFGNVIVFDKEKDTLVGEVLLY